MTDTTAPRYDAHADKIHFGCIRLLHTVQPARTSFSPSGLNVTHTQQSVHTYVSLIAVLHRPIRLAMTHCSMSARS